MCYEVCSYLLSELCEEILVPQVGVEKGERKEKEGGVLGRVSVATCLIGSVICSYLLIKLCEQILVLQDLWVGVERGEGEDNDGDVLGRVSVAT